MPKAMPTEFARAPGVGVIIPVYRRPRMVRELLDSVRGQTRPPQEILVVDDGSGDGTTAQVEDWIARHPELPSALLKLPHGGVSTARARGIARLSHLPLLAIPDSDDLWPPDFLERTAGALQANPRAVAVSTDRLQERRSGKPVLRSLATLPADPVAWIIRRGAGITSCTLARTAALQAVKAYQQDIPSGEDSYVFLRLSRLGPWLHAAGAPVRFRQGGSDVGQEGQLSQRDPHSRYHWAEIIDEFVQQYPAPDPADLGRWQRAIATRWAKVGWRYVRRGDTARAADCYARSVRAWPNLPHSLPRRLIARWLAAKQC